jgi:hypothetical protein
MRLKWLGAALLAVAALAGRARAVVSSATLNIDVTVSASKSVLVNGVGSSTANPAGFVWNGTPNTPFSANSIASSATVTNASGILTETWFLSASSPTIDTSGGGNTWALSTSSSSVGANAFSVQAVFGSSNTSVANCPTNASADWNNSTFAPPLTTGLVQYTANGTFADTNLNFAGASANPDSGNNMLPVAFGNGFGTRALCWKVILPAAATSSDNEEIQIIVNAQ